MDPNGKKHQKAKAADRAGIKSSRVGAQTADSPQVLPQLQQAILDIFREALPISEESSLKQVVQDVKAYLYQRDFTNAFGKEDFLHAYALRWSASRALAYAEIFTGLDVKHACFQGRKSSNMQDRSENVMQTRVACIGGGAGAEVVALAAIANLLSLPPMVVIAIDIADWSSVLSKVVSTVTTPPALSQYASVTKKEANRALLDPSRLQLNFDRQDILECKQDELRLLVADASLVTVMFTMNELFSASIAKTTAFLLMLTGLMQPGNFLLVVDSPGSYSKVTLGKDTESKQYPMKWLLDHTLLQLAGNGPDGVTKWTKCVADDSKWFRIDETLKYPIELENMRYQMHLYQRDKGEDGLEKCHAGCPVTR